MKWKVNIVLNHWKEKQNEYVRSREVNIQITEGWEFMFKW
jgi:hypothetical protein